MKSKTKKKMDANLIQELLAKAWKKVVRKIFKRTFFTKKCA